MLEKRDLKKDLLALGLLALAVFLGAALVSYDPGDPPSKLVYPERAEVLNVCGRSGAFVSRYLFSGLGLGAYYLVISLAALDFMLLARKPINQPVTRTIGWLISLAGLTTLVAMALPQFSPGPVIGSGGYLGAAGRGVLEMNFATVGAYILTVSLVLGGLLLSTDYLLIQILALIVRRPAQGIGQGMMQVGAAAAKHLRRKSDLDGYDPADEHAPSAKILSVRVKGRPGEDVAAVAAGDPSITKPPKALEQTTPPQVAAPQTEAAAPEPAGGITSLLRIRKPKPTKAEVELKLEEPPQNAADYELPSIELLLPSESFNFDEQEIEVRRRAKILEQTFKDFGFNIRVVEIQTGPVIAQFEVELEAGLRLSKITSLADDLAIALRVPSVRIVAPIPGKNTVGIEVPNTTRQIVRLREVIEEANGKAQKMRIPVYIGKDVSGVPMVVDLATLPHLLIAGRTGTGKSVCLNSIITSMVMTRRPDEVRMLMIDPKMVELNSYKSLPHLMHPVVTDMKKAEAILAWAVDKMEERYHLLARAGVRHLSGYNQLGEEELMDRIRPENDDERRQIPTHMPYIVIVADELADLMMTSAKEVETHIIRLAQKSRAVGIHLVLATQKPTVDVITGLIKSNLPARICFQVASRTDSRVVLDEMGADKLLGNGDMLFLWPGTSTLLRGQGTYLSDDEINRVIDAVATTEPQFVKELVQLKTASVEGESAGGVKKFADRDELYEAAIDVVVREGRGSVSLLQRALGIGYGRAARLIDFMAEDCIVGQYNGSQAREVIISLEQWAEMSGAGSVKVAPVEPPKRTNTIMLAPTAERRSTESVPTAADLSEEDDVDIDDPEEEDDDEDEPDRDDGVTRREDEDFDDDDEYDKAGHSLDSKARQPVEVDPDPAVVPQRGARSA
jgi:DNA segregation ATPase FtsK/SpoIIIE, S-DNA-T family